MSNIVIVGSGPAGVSAALYAVRAALLSRFPVRSWSAAALRTPNAWGCGL